MTRPLSEADGTEVKTAVARWIEELTVSRSPLPDFMISELLVQLSSAPLLVDREGNHFLELPGMATLGLGIFQHTFLISGRVIRVGPYLPAGAALTPCCPEPHPETKDGGPRTRTR